MAKLKAATTANAVLDNAERQYKALKANMIARSAEFTTGGTGRDVLSLVSLLQTMIPPLQLAIDTPGVDVAAKAKYTDTNYEVYSNLTALIAKMNTTVTEIVTLIPKNGAGYILLMTLDANNAPKWRAYTGTQLTPVVTKLNEIIAMID